MKKSKIIILVIVLISSLFILSGCTSSNANNSRFIEIYDGGNYSVKILYDRTTKVQYVSYINGHGGTALTVLVDAEGKPLLYKGETND